MIILQRPHTYAFLYRHFYKKYSYKKVLYLDADTLVLDDIVQLYDTPLVNQTIGAVIDPGQAYALKRLGIHSSDYYFNSGVMIIDIDRWNEKAITQKQFSI